MSWRYSEFYPSPINAHTTVVRTKTGMPILVSKSLVVLGVLPSTQSKHLEFQRTGYCLHRLLFRSKSCVYQRHQTVVFEKLDLASSSSRLEDVLIDSTCCIIVFDHVVIEMRLNHRQTWQIVYEHESLKRNA